MWKISPSPVFDPRAWKVLVCILEAPVVVKREDADFDGEIERRDSCTLRQSFDAINNAFITVPVTAL